MLVTKEVLQKRIQELEESHLKSKLLTSSIEGAILELRRMIEEFDKETVNSLSEIKGEGE